MCVYSFEAMLDGNYPAYDPWGKPWPPNSYRARFAGQPLCGGFKFLVCELVGDTKWLREAFHFPHWYGTRLCCHLCCASRDHSPTSFARFSSSSPFPERSHEEYIAHFAERRIPRPALTKNPWVAFIINSWGLHAHRMFGHRTNHSSMHVDGDVRGRCFWRARRNSQRNAVGAPAEIRLSSFRGVGAGNIEPTQSTNVHPGSCASEVIENKLAFQGQGIQHNGRCRLARKL